MTTLVTAITPADLAHARVLFREYADSIASIAACSLQYQRFEEELASLPGKYAPPRGQICLAFEGPPAGEPAGCAALRPLPDLGEHVCELKRMYVRPTFRGKGLGRLLAHRVIADAAALGYTVMKLDTSEEMREALALYRSLGFTACAPYNDDPAPDTIFCELVLAPARTAP